MTARASLEEAIVNRPTASMICAGCDGPMVARKNAVGVEVPRCPKCSPFAPDRRAHPDDAMLPQGLVRATVLPAIEPGQLRCQVCAKGLSTNDRFHPECRGAGLLIVQAMRLERNGRGERRAKR